jgi:NAD(P)-dependent dehydrogenase (short-subunit alcohol dehydrogenase family)
MPCPYTSYRRLPHALGCGFPTDAAAASSADPPPRDRVRAAAPGTGSPLPAPDWKGPKWPRPSKHGVIGLTTSAALEYAPRGIRINAICPGTIETPMVTDMIAKGELDMTEAVASQPINRFGRADQIAASVLWLCSPGSRFIVGVALPVDGGYTAQ